MSKKRIKFTFPQDLITEPIIYQLAQKFKIVTNIRRADVREDMGWVVLELDGDENEINNGLEWVAATGVRVDPVGGDVIQG
ncbi:MAG: NIL domain-containing protein [Chloroflexi bacterium]|nr:NIL domain-containing protein [Chloroflexota bacterium]